MRGQGPSSAAAGPVWTPGEAERERSRLLGAMRRWGFSGLAGLHEASVADPERFWRAVVEDLDITFSTPFQRVLDDSEGRCS